MPSRTHVTHARVFGTPSTTTRQSKQTPMPQYTPRGDPPRVVRVVPVATAADAELAVTAAVGGAAAMRALSGFERAEILRKAADAIEQDVEELARKIALEVGKPLAEARGEAARIAPLLRTSA